MSSRGSGWTAALWPHPETHGAHHRHIARNGVHRRPETVGKCCVSSSDRPAHHHLSTTRPRLHHHTARPANPRISDRCCMSTHGAALRPGGGCLAFVLSRTPIFRQRGTAPTAHARATGRTGWAAADTWSVCVAVGRTHDDSRCMRHRQEAAPSVCGT